MNSTADVLLIPQSTVTSLSSSNQMRFIIGNNPFTIQEAQRLCRSKKPSPSIRDTSWESCPSLNQAVLESMLIAEGISCQSVIDNEQYGKALETALKLQPPLICISTTFICSKSHLEQLIRRIRTLTPASKIIVGGPLVMLSFDIYRLEDIPSDAIRQISQTYLFLNDTIFADVYVYDPSFRGEEKLIRITRRILSGRSVADIEGVILAGNGKVTFRVSPDVKQYRKPPRIRWNHLPSSYFASGVIPMQASVGCPFSCNFCNFPKNGGTASIKSDEEIFNEFSLAYHLGVRYIWFVDDNFRLGKRDLRNFLPELARRNPGIQWMSLFRADVLENIDPHLLRESGCREVCLGLESADNNVLKNMNKRESAEMYADVVSALLEGGVNCSVYFIIGFPGETRQTVEASLDFLKAMEGCQTRAHLFWSIFPFMLVPGSPVFSRTFRKRFRIEGALSRWKHATMDSDTARSETVRLFNTLSDSGPIYRGDDLVLLDRLGFERCREFYRLRQRFALQSFNGPKPVTAEIIRTCSPLFT